MRDPSGRLLRLLSLLQTPREWPGGELAERLGVTARTIRRDVERLRDLGYPVHATRGSTGGYRLTAGTAMPPLLLDDEEATAIAIGLRTAAAGAVAGIEDSSLRALAKLEQVLPHRLRHRVAALTEAAVPLPPQDGAPPAADPAVLALLAAACVTGEKVRFTYTDAGGRATRRLAQPHRLVTAGRRWYLVAHDEDRAAWRTFRADRVTAPHRTGMRGPRRELPGGADAASWAMDALAGGSGTIRARVLLHVPVQEAAEHVTAWQGVLEPAGDRTCVLHTRSDSLRFLAYRVTLLPVDYTLLDPPELAEHLAGIARRANRAVRAFGPSDAENGRR
ncbi:helix-turn-helix transcriptional regulator [Actinomadura madurae]|uniref:helix-turn-helix transcriptional regulator n=1 Tax=Actinomadura madurae TaxID=1993 RepID=UPI002026739E|nr:WYL domain-containing protein [Actinomadura madurae]MCP9964508.1 WYL domain-containing protein [Actinomadura madurae]MCQ0011510.1 WYL domain-containing protein [Actinomadura madurae]URN04134.1 WYL domain-containing protein [Actinomadura madurae]